MNEEIKNEIKKLKKEKDAEFILLTWRKHGTRRSRLWQEP